MARTYTPSSQQHYHCVDRDSDDLDSFLLVEDVVYSGSNENLINILFVRVDLQNLQIERLQRDEVTSREQSDNLHERLVEEEHCGTDLVLRL